ncbi:MAG: histidine--tRNA ligase [Lentisphaerae bacterium]|nr:histidine--tRNA ligase [Lentisphaerota bacterium]
MSAFAPPPGTADIFPAESGSWRFLESTAAKVFTACGYGELRTPIFEYTEIFQRGLGGETEVVQKEMYTFEDRGGRSLTLRPEGTAGVMRALTNTDVANGNEQRVFYYGPMFRGERPSAGRRRQFHQIGVENVGRCAPLIDAECIAMLHNYLTAIGIDGAVFTINTRGVAADREPAEKVLREYFSKHIDRMCPDCRTRLERNIWRILDCKQECCQEIINAAPDYIDSFSAESKAYFEEVKAALTALDVPFKTSSRLVRGLDYYVHTVFEVTHDALGGQIAIAGGGRYELFLPGEKRPLPGVGFATGVERLLMVRDALNVPAPDAGKIDCFFIGLGTGARMQNLITANALRQAGKNILLELEERSFKAQMRAANRSMAPYTVIRGESELAAGIAIVKKMDDGTQCEVKESELIDYLVKNI